MKRLSIAHCTLASSQRAAWFLLALVAPTSASNAADGQVANSATQAGVQAPSIQLPDASVPRVKALSLDSALMKGWSLVESGRDYAVFETPLDEPASAGPTDARRSEKTLLRIRADFSQSPGRVTARLSAREIWRAGTSHPWSTDITDRYRTHLERALTSLSSQWHQLLEADADRRPSEPQPLKAATNTRDPIPLDPDRINQPAREQAPLAPSATTRATAVVPQPSPSIGTWAFEAERLARQRGCRLDELGAVLISGPAPADELHRVGCINRAAIRVRCNRERCVIAR